MFKRLFNSQALADARRPTALLIGLYVAGCWYVWPLWVAAGSTEL